MSSSQVKTTRPQAARPISQPSIPDPSPPNVPQEVIQPSPELVAIPADNEFRRYRSRQTGVEILARQANKPFIVVDNLVESRGEPGWLECHYVEADGSPSRAGWAMTPEEFDRLYEAVV